jgi:formylglycine-generating enzyme required for sulfatase activity
MGLKVSLPSKVEAAEARATALAADLAAARSALESERSKTRETATTSAYRIASMEAARVRAEEALHESVRSQTEARTLRDALAARDAELAALRQEHSKIAAALESREKSATQAEADLQAARARVDAISSELKLNREATALLSAQINRGESLLTAARTERPAVKSQSKVYPEQRAAPMAQRQPGQTAEVESVHPARIAPSVAEKDKSEQELPSAPARGGAWKVRASARTMGLGAAVIIVAVAVWFFARDASAPAIVKAPAASSTGPGTMIRDCPTCPAMTMLTQGRFKQGSSGDVPSVETPQHWVSIGSSFAMSTNAVTVEEFGQFVAATERDMQGCDTYDGAWKHHAEKSWKDPGFVQTGTHPVTCVSWNDAEAYATWLSTKTGSRYRLPSASEWEYAARAGGEAVQPWSQNGSDACANANVADQSAARRYPGWQAFACDDGYVHTAPVGSYKANSFGLNDMFGNVFQWTEDCWHADYSGAPVDGSPRTDDDCAVRELRGGSWFTSPAYVRANYRNHFAAEYRTSSVGIRLVREIAP